MVEELATRHGGQGQADWKGGFPRGLVGVKTSSLTPKPPTISYIETAEARSSLMPETTPGRLWDQWRSELPLSKASWGLPDTRTHAVPRLGLRPEERGAGPRGQCLSRERNVHVSAVPGANLEHKEVEAWLKNSEIHVIFVHKTWHSAVHRLRDLTHQVVREGIWPQKTKLIKRIYVHCCT